MLKKAKSNVASPTGSLRSDASVRGNERTASALNGLASQVESTLEAPFKAATGVAFLDFPEHENLGDNAIWLGEFSYFESNRIPIVHMSSARLYNASRIRRSLKDGTVIVLHGGGNLGDLYPRYQEHRERVIRDFPGTRIVQLPQTVHFEEPQNMRRSLDRLAAHPDLVVLARDARSRELLSAHGVNADLCPDMSHLLLASIWDAPGSGTIVLARSDKERMNPDEPYEKGWRDWPARPHDQTAYLRKSVSGSARLLRLPEGAQNAVWARVWPRIAHGRLERARRLLQGFENVVTDRLHGVLLATLLGRRVIAVDNSYGKVFGYLDTWRALDRVVERAPSLRQASDALSLDIP